MRPISTHELTSAADVGGDEWVGIGFFLSTEEGKKKKEENLSVERWLAI